MWVLYEYLHSRVRYVQHWLGWYSVVVVVFRTIGVGFTDRIDDLEFNESGEQVQSTH
jgi:hypothetical protein